jgi:hypothetical protein
VEARPARRLLYLLTPRPRTGRQPGRRRSEVPPPPAGARRTPPANTPPYPNSTTPQAATCSPRQVALFFSGHAPVAAPGQRQFLGPGCGCLVKKCRPIPGAALRRERDGRAGTPRRAEGRGRKKGPAQSLEQPPTCRSATRFVSSLTPCRNPKSGILAAPPLFATSLLSAHGLPAQGE